MTGAYVTNRSETRVLTKNEDLPEILGKEATRECFNEDRKGGDSVFEWRLGARALNILRKMDGIPVVDFSAMSLENKNPLSDNGEAIIDLADQVYQAFSTIGFVYLKNHGIPQEMVSSKYERTPPVEVFRGHTVVA